MLVGGEENSRMVQVRLMVLPGFTNTEDSAWMTAVAAREGERESERFGGGNKTYGEC